MKKIILIISILLISGCSIDYNLNIKEDTVLENIIINEENFYTFPVPAYKDVQGSSETDEKIEGIEYYDINFSSSKTNISYTFPLKNFLESKAINTCLKSAKTSIVDGKTLLNTSDYFSCFDLYPAIDILNINITFEPKKYKVESNNADYNRGNTYTWVISRSNYKSKNIQVLYSKINQNKETLEDTKDKTVDIYTYLFAGGALIVFLIIIFGMIRYKSLNKEE